MRLTNKATLIVGCALLSTMVASFSSASYLLAADHRVLEEEAAAQRIGAVEGHLEAEATRLALAARETVQVARLLFLDEASWEDNATSALTRSMFESNGLDMIMFRFQMNGTWSVGALSMEDDGFGYVTLPDVPPELFGHQHMGDSRATLFWLDGRPVLAGSHPMTMLDDVVGSLAVGRYADKDLAGLIDADVSLQSFPIAGFSIERPGADRLVARAPVFIGDAPVGTVTVDGDRSLFTSGLNALGWFVLAGASTISVAVVVTAWLLHRNVTGPITRLSRAVQEMDPDAPLKEGNEIEHLEAGFDHMVKRLRAEQQALAATNRELHSFASVVSHDLKSPISAIRLHLANLRHQMTGQEGMRHIERIDTGVTRMAGRIEAVLAYSQAGGRAIAPRPVALTSLMKRVAGDTEAAAREARARLRLSRLPHVMGDPELLAQLFQNLVANALKYRRDGVVPEVCIAAEQDGAEVIVSVRDNGRGFNEEEARHMMEPFVRLSGARDTEGHGIGLATCQRIAQAHGGSLEARGLPGLGAEFRVRLPLAMPPLEGPAARFHPVHQH